MTAILVIDDERLICELLRIMLSRYGYEVHTASSGREGIEAYRRWSPRFTFLDLRLPDMGGIEVLRQIRKIDPQGAVMILTAAPSETLEKQARDLGVTDFLLKGLPVEVLLGAMQHALQKPITSAGSADAQSGTPAPSILIVDDEPEIRYWLTQALTQRNYRVRAAQDGLAALALVEAEQPHLIVSDLNMPGLNGVEFLRRLRAQAYRGGIMILTGSMEDRLLKDALNLGAVDIVSKTADPERIVLAIEARLILTKR